MDLVKENLVKAYVIKKNLELGYSTWMLDGNMLPLSSASFLGTFDQTNDFYVGKTARVLLVRSSSSTAKIWNDAFLSEMASLVDILEKQSISNERILFCAVEKLLEKKRVRFKNIDEMCISQSFPTSILLRHNHRLGRFIGFCDCVRRRFGNPLFWVLHLESDESGAAWLGSLHRPC